MAAQHAAGELADIACAERFNQAQQNAAEHRAAQVADATKHCGGKGFQTRQKAHGVLHGAVVGRPHHPGNGGQDGTNQKGG